MLALHRLQFVVGPSSMDLRFPSEAALCIDPNKLSDCDIDEGKVH